MSLGALLSLVSRSLDHISEGSAGQTFGDTCPSPTALFAHSESAKPLSARFHHRLSSRKSFTQARLPVVWVWGGGVKWISAESCLVGEGHRKGAILGALPSCPVASWHLEMMAAWASWKTRAMISRTFVLSPDGTWYLLCGGIALQPETTGSLPPCLLSTSLYRLWAYHSPA